MIIGIGTDLVKTNRVKDIIAKHGDHFARKILSNEEMRQYQESKLKARFLAKRFAAKEATVKAFGTGFRDGINFTDIEVTHDKLGKPLLLLSGGALTKLQELNGIAHLSLTDETDIAGAFVVIETK